MTPEQYAQIGGGIVVLLGGPPAIKAGLRWWAGYIERRAKARDQREEREDEREDRTEHRLWERLDRVEAHVEECERERRSDALACADRVSKLEARVSAAESAAKKAAADVTQRIDIAAEKVVARRSPPPPRPRSGT
jgi:hypothetical protein